MFVGVCAAEAVPGAILEAEVCFADQLAGQQVQQVRSDQAYVILGPISIITAAMVQQT